MELQKILLKIAIVVWTNTYIFNKIIPTNVHSLVFRTTLFALSSNESTSFLKYSFTSDGNKPTSWSIPGTLK